MSKLQFCEKNAAGMVNVFTCTVMSYTSLPCLVSSLRVLYLQGILSLVVYRTYRQGINLSLRTEMKEYTFDDKMVQYTEDTSIYTCIILLCSCCDSTINKILYCVMYPAAGQLLSCGLQHVSPMQPNYITVA